MGHERIPRVSSDIRSMVFAPYQKHSPFGTVVLAMETTRSHLEMLTRIKRTRLSLRCERERICQNQNTGVEGMGVRLGGEMSRLTYPFDSIPLAFPLGCDLCSIHALVLHHNERLRSYSRIPHPLYRRHTIHS